MRIRIALCVFAIGSVCLVCRLVLGHRSAIEMQWQRHRLRTEYVSDTKMARVRSEHMIARVCAVYVNNGCDSRAEMKGNYMNRLV